MRKPTAERVTEARADALRRFDAAQGTALDARAAWGAWAEAAGALGLAINFGRQLGQDVDDLLPKRRLALRRMDEVPA